MLSNKEADALTDKRTDKHNSLYTYIRNTENQSKLLPQTKIDEQTNCQTHRKKKTDRHPIYIYIFLQKNDIFRSYYYFYAS